MSERQRKVRHEDERGLGGRKGHLRGKERNARDDGGFLLGKQGLSIHSRGRASQPVCVKGAHDDLAWVLGGPAGGGIVDGGLPVGAEGVRPQLNRQKPVPR